MPKGKQKAVPECLCCLEVAVYQDSMNNLWCEMHSNRGKLLEYGTMTHYPDLACRPYAIGAGYDLWFTAASIGSDDYVRVALAAIEAIVCEEIA